MTGSNARGLAAVRAGLAGNPCRPLIPASTRHLLMSNYVTQRKP
jgi:hypothetical protein